MVEDLQELVSSGHQSLAQPAQGYQHSPDLSPEGGGYNLPRLQGYMSTSDETRDSGGTFCTPTKELLGWGVQYDPLFPNTELGWLPQLMLQPPWGNA